MADLHPLLERIAAHARLRPDTTALICEGETLSYRTLIDRALRVAETLGAAGFVAGDRVAFDAARTAGTFVNLLGILVAGGVYVPLSDKAPPVRQAAILANSGARFLLTDDACKALEAPASEAAEPAGYILYTSGSTGTPKGVQITLDNLEAYMNNIQGFYPLRPEDRCAQMADLGFDLSVQEVFHPWVAGATLCVIPTRNVLMWPRYFRDLAITYAALVPSPVRLADAAGLLRSAGLPSLRLGIFGAELVTGMVVRRMRETAPNAQFANFWGPTEATVYFTHFDIEIAIPDHEGVPIGEPWPDQRVILDGEEDGVGEMLLSGSQVSRGYWRMAETNADRFVVRDGVRYYRTGDLARYDADKGYIFVGRSDRQVKVKGNRIELGECEKVIRKHAGIDHAYVIVDGDSLVCAIQPGIDLVALEAAVRSELSSYSVPNRFVVVDEFPFTTSGKIDYKGIRKIVAA